jgi:hemerythrin superfamily protein
MSSRTEHFTPSGTPKTAPRSTVGDLGIFRRLQAEHAEVHKLMARLAEDENPDLRSKLFPKVKRELLAHGRAEQKEFYSVLKRYESTRALATETMSQHDDIEGLLEELDDAEMSAGSWSDLFEELMSTVEAHVDAEENDLFPKAKEVVSQEMAKDLEHRFARQKEVEVENLA